MINRRQFSQAIAGMLAASGADYAQPAAPDPWAGASIVDCHHHLRPSPEANIVHLDGSGISNAVALARGNAADQMQALETKYSGRFLAWFASADITRPDAAEVLTKAVKSGAVGLGEIKFHVEAAGPELRRMYQLAADLGIPILVHFQEVPHTPAEGVFSTGFKNFEAMLKTYPKTRFIGHADAFWANVSAGDANETAYPTGPIKRGGVTDKLLSDYPNLFGDLAANSGNNALSRDPDFTADFLKRHQDKLIFGSDCACTDGKGGGVSQAGNPTASRMAGKCVARETLALLQKTVSPTAFRKMTWENAHRLYKLKT
ncbi:MAG: amidohydrolase family protein [Candidatus Solibacter sp.]|nr:amidohydrolase family protein [Candidatus Solibacter sp.]